MNRLFAGDLLEPGERLVSPNDRFSLVMQEDGNLVLYAHGGGALWASNTFGSSRLSLLLALPLRNGSRGVLKAKLRNDGSLVVIEVDGTAKVQWSSGTAGKGGHHLDVQDDGNVVLYRADGTAVWATNTSGGSPPTQAQDIAENSQGAVKMTSVQAWNDRKSAEDLRVSKLSDLESLIVRVTDNKSFAGQLREPDPHTVMSARELLLHAYATPDTDKSKMMLRIAMELLVRTSSLSFTNETDRMIEIEGASFWRGVIGGILADPSTSLYFELNFADITALVAGGVIDQTTALKRMGRCNEERAEWLRFRGDPEASERYRLAIKAYEGASLPDRARAAATAQRSRAPLGPSSFLERKGPQSGGSILGSSSAYEFRGRLTNGASSVPRWETVECSFCGVAESVASGASGFYCRNCQCTRPVARSSAPNAPTSQIKAVRCGSCGQMSNMARTANQFYCRTCNTTRADTGLY